MRLRHITAKTYCTHYMGGKKRKGAYLRLKDFEGREAWGEIAPLPGWSGETLEEALGDLGKKKATLLETDWNLGDYREKLVQISLLPSASFGFESALLEMLDPLGEYQVHVAALLMGTYEEILVQAIERQKEGYLSAKLKVSQLSLGDAFRLINQLKNTFSLRIDVNRAWKTKDSLTFFEQFPQNTFDYVEEPFQDPEALPLFTHPLALDESFPQQITLQNLAHLPALKAVVYKPTIQGGISHCVELRNWLNEHKKSMVLSSAFETPLGLRHITAMAHRLNLKEPAGICTHHFFNS